jgi:FtsH-binding integral membrane protein
MANTGRRKSNAEARVERLTWGLLVLIFMVFYLFENVAAVLPNWAIPAAGSAVLLGSGVIQYTRRWRVSPITWIAGIVMLVLALIAIYTGTQRTFIVASLIVTLVVILVGTFGGET